MKSLNAKARAAGFLYLVIIICGITSEVLIRSNLIAEGDAGQTTKNILANVFLFRLGFLLDSLMLVCDVAIAVVLYQLLKSTQQSLALFAMVFRLMQAGILGVNLLNYHAVILLLTGTGIGVGLEATSTDSLVMLFLQIHAHGYDLGLIFFACANIFLGFLVIQSGLFPKILGYGLWAAALVYLVGSFSRFLAPEFWHSFQPAYLVPLLAELAFCLWLIFRGVNQREISST